MALVVSSTPLAAMWAKSETVAVDEKRPAERAAAGTSASPSSAYSRRASTGSSNTETLDSSLGTQQSNSSSLGTQQSNSSSLGKETTTKKDKQPRRRRGADVVLHVQDCAFAVHSRVLQHKCRVLHRFIQQLRVKNAVGHLASSPLDSDPGVVGLTSHDEADEPHSFGSCDKQFALRERNRMTTPRAALGPAGERLTRCPLVTRQSFATRASHSLKSTRFAKVCCIAHQRTERSSSSSSSSSSSNSGSQPDAHRSAVEKQQTTQDECFSPGKENYSTQPSSSVVRPRPVPRVALAPKMPFASASSNSGSTRRSAAAGPSISQLQASGTLSPTRSVSPVDRVRVDSNAFAVELIGATADAVAALIEYLYSGKTSGINQLNAATLMSLCRWFCMEDRLLYAALIVRVQSLDSVHEWMDTLLCCTNLRSESKKRIVIDYLLRRLIKLTPDQYRAAMEEMPIHRLAAIEDADLLARVLTAMVNVLRNVEIWKKLTFALELWLFWSFRRKFAAAVPLDHPHPVTVRQPLSLSDFHQKFVSWDPVIRVDDVHVSGIDSYVKATTLFSFGPFVFQIRLEPNRNPLISWRVVRAGTAADADEDPERCLYRPGLEPAFTVRGRLTILYRRTSTGPLLQDEIAVKYTHSAKSYGEWHALLGSSSVHAREVVLAAAEPESEEKIQDPGSSEEATAPLEPQDRDTEADTGAIVLRGATTTPPPGLTSNQASHEASGSSDGSPFEPMTCHFAGQFFAWGHRLCNLYHYLLVSTLFYQVPRGSPRQMQEEAVQARMRELPVETLMLVLQSDRLCVPDGETTVAVAVATLCLSDYGRLQFSIEQMRALFQCVRWCYVDLEQIMVTLEHSRRELQLYELIEQQLRDQYTFGCPTRHTPWGVDNHATPYRATTTLIEFQIEAGDRSLSPSKFLYSQE